MLMGVLNKMVKKLVLDNQSDLRKKYYDRLQRENMTPLWEHLRFLLTPEPKTSSLPYLWNYAGLRDLLFESANLISAEEAERRVLVLENPGLPGESSVTDTLYAGLQLIMPGEIAPPHRHSPSALRLIIEGAGAYTTVNGEKTFMEHGDFIITPAWTWHEHGHEGKDQAVWLDVLDLPIIRRLGAIFTQHHTESQQPLLNSPKDSLYRYGYNMIPEGYKNKDLSSPLFSYPYGRSREALEYLKANSEWDPCHGLKMEYIDPTTGGSAMPSISTFIQLLPKSFVTDKYRSSEGAVFCVIEGKGSITVEKGSVTTVYSYQPQDIFTIPCWSRYTIHAEEESVIFSASDRVIQVKLGVWQEQRTMPDENFFQN